ncbi:aminotransferase class I/II-fold pyridoxal phosphate-dependent enzyme [Streptomyces sp. HNM0575]|uniref:aminotransferase class I/II-fold pyridoxal phosphate-dependent enzyme n=1 Tax=Streptomyces sp. HNM0575 TaxID=2716338 RepID=UPI00145E73BB|nr:aminotransferase class I/II-fold pyridoxal phosphate-dependent enzyme [Streptomyces sp. HNM0575]NLU72848.1 aminotransferase class I/II-fold pyridoxal phosphate-dependent enzyme [Streptomyces sp. HNM0575]
MEGNAGSEGNEAYRQGGSATAVAACGYWRRRGMETRPGQVVAAPNSALLLFAVLATTGCGAVLTPRPCEGWYAPQAMLLDRPLHTVPVPAECGGVPDPVALRETVRRTRGHGHDPRVLVLSVADDCTGTAVPPELLHEVIEVAGDERLLIVSDETWRETSHAPHTTVVVSPAEMIHGGRESDAVVVLTGLGETLLTSGPAAGIARFPDSGRGRGLADSVRQVLRVLRTGLSGPDDAAVADALTEPEAVRKRRAATARAYGAVLKELHGLVTGAGALCRPPRLGRHLYADFEPVRARLDARGIRDSAALEAELVRMFGPYACGGHRLGDDPKALRVRLPAGLLTGSEEPGAAASAGESRVLESVRSALAELTAFRE